MDEAAKVRAWRQGHAAAVVRQRQLLAEEGPQPERTVAEALSALAAMEAMGAWPHERDAVEQRGIAMVRERWVRIQTRARAKNNRQVIRGSRPRSPR